jgi:hypothetical protein
MMHQLLVLLLTSKIGEGCGFNGGNHASRHVKLIEHAGDVFKVAAWDVYVEKEVHCNFGELLVHRW